MKWKTVLFSAAALAALAACPGIATINGARASTCEPEARIDGSTAATAKKTIEAAGFHQVRDLVKGCDNFWHGIAIKEGSESHVVLTPQGQVTRESD